jgi:hypothetical protein
MIHVSDPMQGTELATQVRNVATKVEQVLALVLMDSAFAAHLLYQLVVQQQVKMGLYGPSQQL